MPANKNALIRYKTIDNCLRNSYKQWTLEDLVDACCDSLYEMEGITSGVSVRTVQGDIQMMRSDKLGYNAPIEVYDRKYYRYADERYSITSMPLSRNDCEVMREAIDMLRQLEDFEQFSEMADVIRRLQDKLAISRNKRKPVIHFDRVADLKGLKLLNPLYDYIVHKQSVRVLYQPFKATEPVEYILCPYMLKEYRNRWFLWGGLASNLLIYNLALDRIVSVEPSPVLYRENPEFDSEHFFDDVIGVTKNVHNTPRKVKFWANAEQSRYIQTKPFHPSQILLGVDPDDGSHIFQIEVIINYEMYSTFMSYGPGVKIIYPNYAVSYMKEKLTEASNLYNGPVGLESSYVGSD